jgi:hypothetical protein
MAADKVNRQDESLQGMTFHLISGKKHKLKKLG